MWHLYTINVLFEYSKYSNIFTNTKLCENANIFKNKMDFCLIYKLICYLYNYCMGVCETATKYCSK